VDIEFVRRKLDAFIDTANRSQAISRPPREDYSLHSELRKQEWAVKQILKALQPGLESFDLNSMFPEITARDAAERGLGVLNDREEVAAALTPDAPVLPADQFHPWVWDSARTLWETHHYRQAVQTAWTTINAKIQDKVQRRDLSDTKLVQDTFSESAPALTKPRLRVQGDSTAETVQSRQRGALQLGLACVSLIRNPASHEDSELDEQVALEQLATLSVFARVVAECQVVTS
jgi:hypothetical protein